MLWQSPLLRVKGRSLTCASPEYSKGGCRSTSLKRKVPQTTISPLQYTKEKPLTGARYPSTTPRNCGSASRAPSREHWYTVGINRSTSLHGPQNHCKGSPPIAKNVAHGLNGGARQADPSDAISSLVLSPLWLGNISRTVKHKITNKKYFTIQGILSNF